MNGNDIICSISKHMFRLSRFANEYYSYIVGNNLLYKKEASIMPSTGEKPGKGVYTCDHCGQVIVLDDDTDTMPPCPKCNGTDFH